MAHSQDIENQLLEVQEQLFQAEKAQQDAEEKLAAKTIEHATLVEELVKVHEQLEEAQIRANPTATPSTSRNTQQLRSQLQQSTQGQANAELKEKIALMRELVAVQRELQALPGESGSGGGSGDAPRNATGGGGGGSSNGNVKNPGLKFQYFSGDGSVSWPSYRLHFENLCDLYQYADEIAKKYLRSSMIGEALDAVGDLMPAQYSSLSEMLDAYADKFQPPAAQALAQTTYETAKQDKEETILSYHNRMKKLFRNAYPDRKEGWKTDKDLIKRFILGLKDKHIRYQTNVQMTIKQVSDYALVLSIAQGILSVTHQEEFYHHGGRTRSSTAEVAALQVEPLEDKEAGESDVLNAIGVNGTPYDSNKYCKHCTEVGHWKEDCQKYLLKKFKDMKLYISRGNRSNSRGGYSNQGNRGGWNNQGGNNRQNSNQNGNGYRGGNRGRGGRFNGGRGRGSRPNNGVNSIEESVVEESQTPEETGDQQDFQ